MDDAALLDLAAGLAERAAAEIRTIRDRGFQVHRKADHSVVTEADHAAEAIILAGLRQALPGCTVVAEEEAAGGTVTAATAEFWLVDPLDGTREFIAARRPPPEGLTVVASRHHGDQARLDAFLGGRTVARVVNFGSSLKFCRLAEGQADLYPRFGRTMEWDTCAPHAVLEAAGGSVETLDGQPLRYGKPSWDNPHFVCWGVRAA
jgi:3'(2'), 5'-bisphosphate nucleotidase